MWEHIFISEGLTLHHKTGIHNNDNMTEETRAVVHEIYASMIGYNIWCQEGTRTTHQYQYALFRGVLLATSFLKDFFWGVVVGPKKLHMFNI